MREKQQETVENDQSRCLHEEKKRKASSGQGDRSRLLREQKLFSNKIFFF